MKLFTSKKRGKAGKRFISLALTVAALLTALVVIPVTLTTKVEAAQTSSAYGAFSKPSASKNQSNVFYASQWADEFGAFGSGMDCLFGAYNDTHKTFVDEGRVENFYHKSNTFVLRYAPGHDEYGWGKTEADPDDNGGCPNPYVYVYPCATHVWGGYESSNVLSASEYKYITITYAVYNANPDRSKYENLQMAIYPLAGDMNNYGESKPLKAPLEFSHNADDNRMYHTAIFDLTDFASGSHSWTGKIRGFRFDYFDSNVPKDFTNMVMFVDSIGFFQTMDEVDYHVRERDWARNSALKGYGEDANDRNVFTAVSRSLGGYFQYAGPGKMNEPNYIATERAYKLEKRGDSKDDFIYFFMCGSSGANRYDRSLSTEYCHLAISVRVDRLWTSSIDIGTMQMFLYKNTGGDVAEACSVKNIPQEPLLTDRYYTFYFDLSGIVNQVDRIYGMRMDMTNLSGDFDFYIDSIGFFKTKEEAMSMGRAAAYLVKNDMLYGDRAFEHNIALTPSAEQDAIEFKVKADCGHGLSSVGTGSDNACGHLKYEYDQKGKLNDMDLAVDPHERLLFKGEGRVSTNDYRYLVITYKLPSTTFNALDGLCPPHDCSVCNHECFNHSNDTLEDLGGHIPLRFFPCVDTDLDPEKEYVTECMDYSILRKLNPDGYDVWVNCVLELTDDLINRNDIFKVLYGVRVDLFDTNLARVNSSIYISEIKLVSSETEAYENVETKNRYNYQINIKTDENLGGNSGFKTTTRVDTSASWGGQSKEEAFIQPLSAQLLADMALLREHYDFIGWKAYYKDSEGKPIEIPMKSNGEFDIPISSTVFTTHEYKEEVLPDEIGKYDYYVLEVTMVAQWRLSTQLLTINPPTAVGDEACIYRITGSATDSQAYTFAPLLVSGVSDGISNDSVKVRLPDGTYTVELLTDWGWRYAGAAGLTSDEILIYGAGAITTDIYGISSKGEGKTGSQSFANVSLMNPYWVNGHGYGHVAVSK